MKATPNPSVPLVGQDGRPTSPLLDILPQLSAVDVVVDRQGLPTPLFLTRLRGAVEQPLPNARAQIVNANGTPTRVFTSLLAALP